MIFSKINVRKVLIREKDHQLELLKKANDLLFAAAKKDTEIISRLKKKSLPENNLLLSYIDNENIFSLEEIRKICIRYRLRFLDSSLFKSDYPYEAIAEISEFEKKYATKINSFRIIAPSKEFELENINKDPLLFAKLNENSYFLLHQWGNDLCWYRKLLYWPMQSFKTLIFSLSIICFLLSFSIPSSVMHIFNLQSEIYLRIWLTIHTFIGLLGISLWIGISFDKNFSSMNWDSKYFNY